MFIVLKPMTNKTNKNHFFLIFVAAIILVSIFSFVLAQETPVNPDTEGFELEKLISLINFVLALTLSIFTFIAYKRSGKSRLLFVSLAFILLAIRSFLVGYELIGGEISLADPVTVSLDFIAMLSFFYGVLKK